MQRRGFCAFLLAAPLTRILPAKYASGAAGRDLTTIVISTLATHREELKANVIAHNKLLYQLRSRGKN